MCGAQEQRLYKVWVEYFNLDEHVHSRGVQRVRDTEDEPTGAPMPGDASVQKGGKGGKGKGKDNGQNKGGKGNGQNPGPKSAAKKEKTPDQLARNVPRLWFVFMVG